MPVLRVTAQWRRVLRAAILVAAAVIVTAFTWLWKFNNPFVSDDHWFYMVPGWQMLYGDLPVRDFVEYGAPLHHAIAGGVQIIWGRSILSEVVFSVTTVALCAGGIFLLGYRASGSIVRALAGTAFYILNTPRLYGYPKVLLAVVTIPALWAFVDRPGRRRVAILAVITVIGFLWRHDHGVWLALTCLLWLACLAGLPVRRRLQYSLLYMGLVCGLAVPYLIYVEMHGGVFSYFATAIDWVRRDGGRTEFSWPSLFAETDVVRVRETAELLPRAAAVIEANAVAWLYYMQLLLPVVAVVLLAVSSTAFRHTWPHAQAKIGAVLIVTFAVNAAFLLRSPIEPRLGDPVAPQAVLIAWMIGAVAARPADLRPWLRRRFVAPAVSVVTTAMIVALLTIVALAVTSNLSRQVETTGLDRGLGEALQQTERLWNGMRHALPIALENPPSPDSLTTLAVFVRECTYPRDRVFLTHYNLAPVLGLAERAFAAGLAPDPNQGGSPEFQRLAVRRLQQQSVPIALVGSGPSWGNFRQDLPILTAYFDEHYDSVAEHVFDGRFGLRLLLRRGVPVVGTFEPLGWPCAR